MGPLVVSVWELGNGGVLVCSVSMLDKGLTLTLSLSTHPRSPTHSLPSLTPFFLFLTLTLPFSFTLTLYSPAHMSHMLCVLSNDCWKDLPILLHMECFCIRTSCKEVDLLLSYFLLPCLSLAEANLGVGKCRHPCCFLCFVNLTPFCYLLHFLLSLTH